MSSICELFAKKYFITFNIKKTICIKFGSDVDIDEGAYMYGKRLEWSDTVKHLGNIVNKDLDDLDDCKLKGGVFIGSVNKLLGNFGKLQPNIVYNLFNSYCCSFYGSQLWNPNSYCYCYVYYYGNDSSLDSQNFTDTLRVLSSCWWQTLFLH